MSSYVSDTNKGLLDAMCDGLILIAEDDRDLLKMLKMRCERIGCSVLAVDDALSAISCADFAMPSLIILDVQMPGGNGLAVDFKGNVIGIYLGQMLRGTTGRNNFGNSNLTIALDGKINATNMHLSGAGGTPEEIRNGLKGTATLGGYLYPAVDQSSRSSALFLGGIGSLFSDDLKAAVLVLQRFVNRQNPIQGQVTLANGAITTNNQQISGDRASALGLLEILRAVWPRDLEVLELSGKVDDSTN